MFAVASWAQGHRDSGGLPPKGADQCVIYSYLTRWYTDHFVVLTGSKDGTMLLGEIEPTNVA